MCTDIFWILSKTYTNTNIQFFVCILSLSGMRTLTENYEFSIWGYLYMFVLFMRTVCRIAVRLFTFIFKLSLEFSSYENYCILLTDYVMVLCVLYTVKRCQRKATIAWKTKYAHRPHMIMIHVLYCICFDIGLKIQCPR